MDLKLIVSYPTNEKCNVTKHTHQIVDREIEVDVKKIFRNPSQWDGMSKNRYNYYAIIPEPDDLNESAKGIGFVCKISRKQNPHFKPTKMKFDGAYWTE